MATSVEDRDHDPGGSGKDRGVPDQVLGAGQQISYADRLKTNVSYNERLKRNILEITLEKTEKEAEMVLNQECVAKVLRSIGMDIVTQVEGYQVQYNGRTSLISVWAAKGLDLERFCKEEGIKVT